MKRPLATAPGPLDGLADLLGIERIYETARGETAAVSDRTIRALLDAMGMRAADDAEARDALEHAVAADWRRALPTVVVDRTGGQAVAVPVTLPAGSERVAWKVCFEEGGETVGEAALADLERIDARAVGGVHFERFSLVLHDLPLGYHGLTLNEPGIEGVLIVTPEACWLPDEIESGRRLFGVAAQLYLLRSGRNWGIGDFADLDRLVAIAADRGADIVGLNPLHALFMDDPEAASPYSPASRLLLNPLSIAIDRLPSGPRLDAYRRSPEVRARIEAARATAHVDYTSVVALKSEALRRAYADFREAADEARRRALDDFVAAQGEGFRRGCLFLALRESFAQDKPPRPDWRNWPEDYRSPGGPGVMRFMEDAPEAIDYQRYLQFIADEQLAASTADARARGMAVGLYRDLAVGADSTGAETWSGPEAVVRGVSVGAPPDIFMPTGQSWGLPPFHPRALHEEAYASFVELVRANMRHAGGLRIDHVMGLQHLWWVPDGMSPADGAYVEYPLDDLVGIIALESHRNRCLVIGEDLGTVSDGFRERMADAGILSYRVLFFEQDFNTGAFRPASSYPAKAMAVCGSHDLPTLRGWWLGVDNDLKERLGLFPGHDETAAQRARRDRDRDTFVALLRADGLLPAEGEVDEAAFVQAATAFLAETSSAIAMVQLDDITGEVQPVNVPSTHREYPNWRRKYRATLEEIGRDEAAWACVRPLAGRVG